jgi:hypothetical protein
MADSIVTLTVDEYKRAVQLGLHRQWASIRSDLHNKAKVSSVDGWTIHVLGALGEYAFAKAAHLPFRHTLFTFHAPDVAGWQVRCTKTQPPCLIIRPGDSDHDSFVLVQYLADTRYRVCGWISGREAKQSRWLTDRGNGRPAAWFVPADALHAIDGGKEL